MHAVELLEVVRSHSRNPYKRYGCEVKMKCKAMPRKDGNGGNPNDGAVAGGGGKGKKGRGKAKRIEGKRARRRERSITFTTRTSAGRKIGDTNMVGAGEGRCEERMRSTRQRFAAGRTYDVGRFGTSARRDA